MGATPYVSKNRKIDQIERNRSLRALHRLDALGARINFPLPFGNYYSLQFLFVLLAGILLGPYYGALSLGLYVALGLMGFPLFAAGGGIAYVVKPTFGFLLGFVAAAFVTGTLVQILTKHRFSASHRSLLFLQYLVASLGGLVVTYGFGIFYMYFANHAFLASKCRYGHGFDLFPH